MHPLRTFFMLYTWLTEKIEFPPVSKAKSSGILALGGDLSTERLILAYNSGIFPWFSEDDPIIWWSPKERFVIFPEKLYVSKTMRQILKRNTFTITFDKDFPAVIQNCQQTPREGQDGTWITSEMMEAYIKLHKLGYAHSVEVWQDDKIVGGLYGIIMGGVFCGESMFAHTSNASKAGFITLVQILQSYGIVLIDCQTHTEHLESLGGEMIPRNDFIKILQEQKDKKLLPDDWATFSS
jgi:leucyl/phenylalanyl-tRNA---protein transferase